MDLNQLSESSVKTPAMAQGQPNGKAAMPAPDERPFEPRVHGESMYDRVTSMLISVVMGTAIIVGWLGLVYYANQAYASKVVSEVEIIEVNGNGGGGDPEGEVGGTGEAQDFAGGEAGAVASNNMDDAGAFEEPSVQATSSAPLDALAESANGDGEASDSAGEVSSGGAVATGRRTSKAGNGLKGLGPGGPGEPGFGRGARWVFVAPQGQSAEEYAKQLDSLGIELGTFSGGNVVTYASNFTGTPVTRTGLSGIDKRLHVTWQGVARRQYDMELMKKAGLNLSPNAAIMQFFPDSLTQKIARLEYNFKGRQPAEIALTRFTVQPSGGGYQFVILEQKALR